ncbi:cell division protein ZapA [Pseudooctadecabacter jejudonensis]|uniref:Cell division protein ZapA n=1 Tax=Pseudooctadecabacter jejudonensis TaxID=1391910 RepID=A0A1Y5RB54_9RHOB|nr:cell division protein ZapA [Pseudooctadecabacter jejudonensis]SLN12195.1 Cell division protein ZapA [Pseudooctadecabacter jejudonensis]
MPEVEIKIGGRSFSVACQDGEEQFLMTAAAMLDVEASSLSTQVGRMPESRMLLMAGLLLADRTAGLEDKVREAEGKLAQVQAQLDVAQTGGGAAAATPEPVEVEVAVLPQDTVATLEALAAEAEAVADHVEARAG